jgi:hypothetical protein
MRAVIIAALSLLCATMLCAPAAAAPPYPFIHSVTQSGDMSVPNEMLQFNPRNVSDIYGNVSYPFFEETIGRAYDASRRRIFFYTESFCISVYDAVSMQQTSRISMDVTSEFSVAFHYDPVHDRLWLAYPTANTGLVFCWIPASQKQSNPTCPATLPGNWGPSYDMSAFDPVSRILTVQMDDDSGVHHITSLNVDTLVISKPAAMLDLCQGVEAVDVNGTVAFVCVSFTFNTLVTVDPVSGNFSAITSLPFLENPIRTSATALRQPESQTSRYFVQLYGAFVYTFAEFDIRSGKILASSTIPVGQAPELAYCTYVGK